MPGQVNGLPAHILLVHVVVVLVPLAALLTLLSALLPAARRRLAYLTPLVALAALIAVPITMNAGEWLRDRVFRSALVNRHVSLGDQLLPWALGLFLVALGQWIYYRRTASVRAGAAALVAADGGPPSGGAYAVRSERRNAALPVVIAVLAVAVSVGSVFQVYRIGESGSKAVWTGTYTTQPK